MRKIFNSIFAVTLGIILITSCNTKTNEKTQNQDYLIYATIWYQHSPEMKALYLQGFNIASENLKLFAKQKTKRPKAVVVDIDETMLNNVPFQAQEIIDNKPFSSDFWNEWTKLAKAEALPGAKEFSLLCDSLGIQLFYISNRSTSELDVTVRNLDSLGFAFATPDHFLLKENTSSKKERREKVMENYDIVMLVGDNLADFTEVFESREDDWDCDLVNQYKSEFGKRFIILPNPMYGGWEKNIYTKKSMTDMQKDSAQRSVLIGFK